MSRRIRVNFPPPGATDNPDMYRWMQDVTDALNRLPNFSIFSTSDGPNTSGETTSKGVIGIEIGSSTTLLWIGSAEGTSTWSALSYIL